MTLEKADKIIFMISGGIGKNIMATAVVQALKNQHPEKKIVIATAWIDAWLNNPNVEKIYNITHESEIYAKEISRQDAFVFTYDPYFEENFIYKRKNLIEVWCDMLGVRYNGEKTALYFTEAEQEAVRNKLPIDKPLFFIQTSGGAGNQEFPISWTRDMPLKIAQEVVNRMNALGYRTIHLRRADQYALDGAEFIEFNIREMLCSILFSDKRLFIDSVAQHAASALDRRSVVTWVGNDPKIFGYQNDINMRPKIPAEFRHAVDAYLETYNITGVLHECPYDTDELFDVDEIMKNLRKI